MRVHARPAPVLRPRDEARTNRIQRHVAHRNREMRLVHGDGPKAALPEMPGPPQPRVDRPGIAPMHRSQSAPQPIGIGGRQDQVNVVGHQDLGPDLDIGRAAGLRKQIAIKRVIGIRKEGLRSAIAALRDVMWHTRDHEARKAAHTKSIADRLSRVNLVHCHRNSCEEHR